MQTTQKSEQFGSGAKRLRYRLWMVVTAALIALFLGVRHKQSRLAEDDQDDHAIASALERKVARLTPEARLPALLTALQDPNPHVRSASIGPLASLRTPGAVDAVEEAFRDSSFVVRDAALEALPQMDRERSLKLDLAALVDDDLWIRESAINHLNIRPRGLPVDKRAIPTLIRALEDSSPVVQTTAMGVLRRLTGNDWRCSSLDTSEARQIVVRRWKKWWAGDARRATIPAEFNAVGSRPSTRLDPAPDFHLKDINGQEVSLTGMRGKVLLLNFWGTWCPPCRKEIPDLIRLDAAYHGKGVEIVGVALAEQGGAESLRSFCAKQGITYRQTLAINRILDAYGHIEEAPVSVLIDARGNIRNRWEGERDYGTFQAAVERALQN
jgi:peroxiredoxin